MDAKQFPENVDVALVEGSVSTEEDLHKIKLIRKNSKILVSLGDCAVTGNIPSMRTVFPLEKVLERPPYNLIVHTAPLQEAANAHYHWHIEIIPKLTRVAGFEWGTGFYINPTPPEESAQFLRDAGLA